MPFLRLLPLLLAESILPELIPVIPLIRRCRPRRQILNLIVLEQALLGPVYTLLRLRQRHRCRC